MVAFAVLCSQALADETVAPLPPSAYTVSAACSAPAPGHAACLALRLVAKTGQARAYTHPLAVTTHAPARPRPSVTGGDFGLAPQDLHAAYQLPASTSASATQTIALVDAYNDPTAEADLETYDTEFGLPKCTSSNGCFEQVNQRGEASTLPFPQTQESLEAQEKLCAEGTGEACELVKEADGWTVEISLDIETAHSVCQNCRIVLVEASSSEYEALEEAEDSAVRLDATVISNSWGGSECITGHGCASDSAAFNHPGIVITVAAGDYGYKNWLLEATQDHAADFPASLPQVVAVGGTRLSLGTHDEWAGETVWNDGGKHGNKTDGFGAGGGGCSVQFTAQPWQQSVSDWQAVGCGEKRAVADIAADADPYTGVAVYDSNRACETEYEEEGENGEIEEGSVHWCTIGGTSLASPQIAAAFALAGGAHGVPYPARTLYENAAKSPSSLHDVTQGSNGECASEFDKETGASACTAPQEAKTSCSSHLICLAGAGYDGPTGLGTPDGLAAFEPPAGAPSNGGSREEEVASEESVMDRIERLPRSTAPSSSSSTWPAPVTTITNTSSAQTVQLTGLALTAKALVALNKSHPKVASLAFTFTLNLATHVHTSLEELIGRRAHRHWKMLGHPLTIAALSGRNRRGLGGRGVLSPGVYRLTLAPVGGKSRSIVFKIG